MSMESGPFGLHKGMKFDELRCEPKEPAWWHSYDILNVPRPHSAFVRYVACIMPGFGLSSVTAHGESLEARESESELKRDFLIIRKKLEGIYGAHEISKTLDDGRRVFYGSNEWVDDLWRSGCSFNACWSEKGGSTLKNALSEVRLSANVHSDNKRLGYIALSYSFDTAAAVDSLIYGDEDGVL